MMSASCFALDVGIEKRALHADLVFGLRESVPGAFQVAERLQARGAKVLQGFRIVFIGGRHGIIRRGGAAAEERITDESGEGPEGAGRKFRASVSAATVIQRKGGIERTLGGANGGLGLVYDGLLREHAGQTGPPAR